MYKCVLMNCTFKMLQILNCIFRSNLKHDLKTRKRITLFGNINICTPNRRVQHLWSHITHWTQAETVKTNINENLKAQGAKINHDIIFSALMHHKYSGKRRNQRESLLCLVYVYISHKKKNMDKQLRWASAAIMTDRSPTAPDIRIE